MVWLRRARAAAGFLAVVVLLGLFVADFLGYGTLGGARVQVLLGLIAALLGLDKVGEALPVNVEITNGGENGGESDTTTEKDP